MKSWLSFHFKFKQLRLTEVSVVIDLLLEQEVWLDSRFWLNSENTCCRWQLHRLCVYGLIQIHLYLWEQTCILFLSFSQVAFSPTQPTQSSSHQNSPERQHRRCSISRTWLLSAGQRHDLRTCEYFTNPAALLHPHRRRGWWNSGQSERMHWIRETEEHNFSLWSTVWLSFSD